MEISSAVPTNGKVTGSRSDTNGASLGQGSVVDANFQGQGTWFPGCIVRVCNGGNYDIKYDDGDSEENVPVSRIRLLAEGSFVEANYAGKGQYYTGKIAKDNKNGTYDIDYDDGESEQRVRRSYIRVKRSPLGVTLPNSAPSVGTGTATAAKTAQNAASTTTGPGCVPIVEGTIVDVNFKNRGKWFPGKVVKAWGNDSYDIRYDDGEMEESIASSRIRVLSEGSVVEANYAGRGKYFSGKVAKDHGDGTYDIAYDDGENEERVRRVNIRVLTSPSATPSVTKPTSVGTVEYVLDAMGNISPRKNPSAAPAATATRGSQGDDVVRQSTLSHKTNGEQSSLPATPSLSRHSSKVSLKINEGSIVDANLKNKGKWLPGKVVKDWTNSTFDIRYDDGDMEECVPAVRIRVLAEGSLVEANYGGRGKFFPGKVVKDHGDGTYDIAYDDGENEEHVRRGCIHVIQSPDSSNKVESVGTAAVPEASVKSAPEAPSVSKSNYMLSPSLPPEAATRKGSFDAVKELMSVSPTASVEGLQEHRLSSVELAAASAVQAALSSLVGVTVDANYRGENKWFPGRIAKDHGDGTYDIHYDDDDQEEHVPADRIRVLAEGSLVEAKYGGRGKYYSGKVKKDHGDGTYDIAYDDGENEGHVRREMIRVSMSSTNLPAGKASNTNTTNTTTRLQTNNASSADGRVSHHSLAEIKQGVTVDVNYKDKGKWLPAKVARDRSDGTFDIRYDDGDMEECVPAVRIRVLAEGSLVEANYGGRGKFFPGKVKKDNGDGTYDIAYDDGENENRVRRANIKVLQSPRRRRSLEGHPLNPAPNEHHPPNVAAQTSAAVAALTAAAILSPSGLKIGTLVDANQKNRGTWLAGKILRDRGDDEYDVMYDHGDIEEKVSVASIRVLCEGAAVEGNYKGHGKWYPGRITKDLGDGKFDITYDDNERETNVARRLIRTSAKTVSSSTTAVTTPAPAQAATASAPCADPVLAEFLTPIKSVPLSAAAASPFPMNPLGTATASPFPLNPLGTATASPFPMNPLGSATFLPFAGAAAPTFPSSSMAQPSLTPLLSPTSPFPAAIASPFPASTAFPQPSFAPMSVPPSNAMNNQVSNSSSVVDGDATLRSRSQPLKVGDLVEANFKMRGVWLPGKVKKDWEDDTYDILFDDGSKEEMVSRSRICLLTEGVPVRVDYRGQGKYYPGKVTKVHGDDTIDIRYDDGDSEMKVERSKVRVSDSLTSAPPPVANTTATGQVGGPTSGSSSFGSPVASNPFAQAQTQLFGAPPTTSMEAAAAAVLGAPIGSPSVAPPYSSFPVASAQPFGAPSTTPVAPILGSPVALNPFAQATSTFGAPAATFAPSAVSSLFAPATPTAIVSPSPFGAPTFPFETASASAQAAAASFVAATASSTPAGELATQQTSEVTSQRRASVSFSASSGAVTVFSECARILRKALLRKAGGEFNAKELVKKIYKHLDADHNGQLTTEELRYFLLSPDLALFPETGAPENDESFNVPELNKLLDMLTEEIDMNRDGTISLTELQEFLFPEPQNLTALEERARRKAHKGRKEELEIGFVLHRLRQAIVNLVGAACAAGPEEDLIAAIAKAAKTNLRKGNLLEVTAFSKWLESLHISEDVDHLSHDEVAKIVKMSLDGNNDGVISAKELKQWLSPNAQSKGNDALRALKRHVELRYDGDVLKFTTKIFNPVDSEDEQIERMFKDMFINAVKIDGLKNVDHQELALKVYSADNQTITPSSIQRALSTVEISGSTPRSSRRDSFANLIDPVEGAGQRRGSMMTTSFGNKSSDRQDAEEYSHAGRSDPVNPKLTSTATISVASMDTQMSTAALPPKTLLSTSLAAPSHTQEPIMHTLDADLPHPQLSMSASWAPRTGVPLPVSQSPLKKSRDGYLGGGAVGRSQEQLEHQGYVGHMGMWRGWPYDCWSCCNSSEKTCPLSKVAVKTNAPRTPKKSYTSSSLLTTSRSSNRNSVSRSATNMRSTDSGVLSVFGSQEAIPIEPDDASEVSQVLRSSTIRRSKEGNTAKTRMRSRRFQSERSSIDGLTTEQTVDDPSAVLQDKKKSPPSVVGYRSNSPTVPELTLPSARTSSGTNSPAACDSIDATPPVDKTAITSNALKKSSVNALELSVDTSDDDARESSSISGAMTLADIGESLRRAADVEAIIVVLKFPSDPLYALSDDDSMDSTERMAIHKELLHQYSMDVAEKWSKAIRSKWLRAKVYLVIDEEDDAPFSLTNTATPRLSDIDYPESFREEKAMKNPSLALLVAREGGAASKDVMSFVLRQRETLRVLCDETDWIDRSCADKILKLKENKLTTSTSSLTTHSASFPAGFPNSHSSARPTSSSQRWFLTSSRNTPHAAPGSSFPSDKKSTRDVKERNTTSSHDGGGGRPNSTFTPRNSSNGSPGMRMGKSKGRPASTSEEEKARLCGKGFEVQQVVNKRLPSSMGEVLRFVRADTRRQGADYVKLLHSLEKQVGAIFTVGQKREKSLEMSLQRQEKTIRSLQDALMDTQRAEAQRVFRYVRAQMLKQKEELLRKQSMQRPRSSSALPWSGGGKVSQRTYDKQAESTSNSRGPPGSTQRSYAPSSSLSRSISRSSDLGVDGRGQSTLLDNVGLVNERKETWLRHRAKPDCVPVTNHFGRYWVNDEDGGCSDTMDGVPAAFGRSINSGKHSGRRDPLIAGARPLWQPASPQRIRNNEHVSDRKSASDENKWKKQVESFIISLPSAEAMADLYESEMTGQTPAKKQQKHRDDSKLRSSKKLEEKEKWWQQILQRKAAAEARGYTEALRANSSITR